MHSLWHAVLLFSFISQSSLVHSLPSSGYNGMIARGDGDMPGSSTQGGNLKCHGVGGDVWMISRDQAVSAALQFCTQDSWDKEYFQGSVNEVKLSIHNTNDLEPLSDAHCIDAFTKIIDGCDANDPLNNPHNYKFGGTYTSPDGWELKLEPQAQKPDEDSCDVVSYKFVYDGFEVRGKNFPDAKLGANGEGLKKQIKGCGKLTKWKFEWTPNDVKYQWLASGQLPIGTRSCLGSAVKLAGGSTAGHCHGPG